MVAVSGGASGVIEDPYRFLPLIFRNESACCVLFQNKHEKFCNVCVLLLFFHWDSVPLIRPSPHTMVLWGAIRLELVGPIHVGVVVNNSK